MNVLSRVSDQAWSRVFAIDSWSQAKNACGYCHAPINRKDLTSDHLKPRSRGGTTFRHNIKGACLSCNQTKGSLPEKQYLKKIKSPRRGDNIHIWLAWSRRRVWLRAERACNRIIIASSTAA
jgi:hypothetical protein